MEHPENSPPGPTDEAAFLRQRLSQLEQEAAQSRRGEAQLFSLLEQGPDAFVCFEFLSPPQPGLTQPPPTVIVQWNHAAERLSGYSREEILGKPITILVPPENEGELLLIVERLRLEGVISQYETVGLRKDGSHIEISVSLAPLRNEDGVIIGASAVARDISERTRAERHIRFQASLLDQVRNAVIAIDHESKITYWNKYAEVLYQWRPEEVLGRSSIELMVPPETRGNALAMYADVLRSGNWEGNYRVLRKDGSSFQAHVTLAVLRNSHGELIGCVGVSEDITEREQAAADLQAQKEILQTIFDHVPVMIAFTDVKGRLSLVNRHFEKTIGWSNTDVRYQDVLNSMYPDREEYRRTVEYILHPPSGWGEFRTHTRDGRVLDTSWANVLLEDGTSIGIGLDVSERKRTEEERDRLHQEILAGQELLEILSRRLMEAQETERRNLARELHDEIGQILTTVSLTLDGLRPRVAPALWPRLEEGVQVVHRAIEQVRDLSFDLRPASLDLLGLESALRAYLSRQADRGGISLEFQSNLGDRRLPPNLEIITFRVVQEAMTNVLRHANARQCRVELRHEEGELRLTIRDDGKGFDVAGARQRAMQGEGFGLVGMLERVQLFGGTIEIDSVPGRGTLIRVHFPIPPPLTEK